MSQLTLPGYGRTIVGQARCAVLDYLGKVHAVPAPTIGTDYALAAIDPQVR